MADLMYAMPPQFHRWAATAAFIVHLYDFFCEHGPVVDYQSRRDLFGKLPAPPDHLDVDAVQDCGAIASMLAKAVRNQCKSDQEAQYCV